MVTPLVAVPVIAVRVGAMQRDGNNTGRVCGLSRLTIGLIVGLRHTRKMAG